MPSVGCHSFCEPLGFLDHPPFLTTRVIRTAATTYTGYDRMGLRVGPKKSQKRRHTDQDCDGVSSRRRKGRGGSGHIVLLLLLLLLSSSLKRTLLFFGNSGLFGNSSIIFQLEK